jgi:hypothetical protein
LTSVPRRPLALDTPTPADTSPLLEEVVAKFTDDAFATFVVAPEPFYVYGKVWPLTTIRRNLNL